MLYIRTKMTSLFNIPVMACLIKRCENGDGQGDKFRYQVDTRLVLLLGPP